MDRVESSKLKVLFLITHLDYGGAEKVLSDLSCNFPPEIEQVIILFERRIVYPFRARIIVLDLPTSPRSFFRRAYIFAQRLLRVKEIIKAEQPDCVVSFLQEENAINILVSPNPVITVHNHLSKVNKGWAWVIDAILIRMLYNKARIVAVSAGVKEDLVKKFHVSEKRITVINNPIDTRKIQSLSEEKTDISPDNGCPVIITSGRLTRQKGQWHLIRAFSEVRKKIESKLFILGRGELEGYLMGLTKELDLEKEVVFLGWREKHLQFFKNADVFVLSSLWEGFGNVLIEAMACGLPVIAADCLCGPREILSPKKPPLRRPLDDVEYTEFGVLTPVCNGEFLKAGHPLTEEEKLLAQAIIRMLKDNTLSDYYSRAGKKRSYDFDVDKIVRQYLSVFEYIN